MEGFFVSIAVLCYAIIICQLCFMEISTIKDWLQQPSDYNAGVLLFEKYGSNKTLLALFKSGATFFTKKKLHLELTNIAKSNAAIISTSISSKEKIKTTVRVKIVPELLPAHLKIEYNKLGDLIRQIGHLHGKLTVIDSDKQRGEIAFKIIDLVEQRRSIYTRLDNYVATGKDLLKVEEKPVITESEELKKFRLKNELQLLRSSRSKLKKKPHRVDDYNAVLEKIKVIQKQISNEG